MSTGETNLGTLLKTMSPVLATGGFVFVTFAQAQYGDHAELQPIATFNEPEGLTLVVPKECADQHHARYDTVFSVITLQVHSSLEAVGLTAAFSAALAEQGISANVIAGFYHDHIFVQQESAATAMAALNALTQ